MKKFSLVLAVILCLSLVLTGCGKEEKKTLVMATEATFPPYEYHEGDEIVGIDVEIATAIANELGCDLKVEDMAFASVIAAVESGKADMALAGLTVTPERLESVNFTTSYATGIQAVIVKEDSDIKTVDDLFRGDITVGVQTRTTGDLYCTGDIEEAGLGTVERYNTGTDAVQALLTGKIDCVVIDNEPAKRFIEVNDTLTILDTEYAVEDYAICIAKDNDELLNQVNEILEKMIEEGKVQEIVDKYIVAE